jgi:hypothetical protein
VENIVALYRSANDMQVALPGHTSQRASGFLCSYKKGDRLEVVAAFHLQEENILGFYTWDKGSVSSPEVRAVVEEGLGFFEAMGFMMGDLELASFSLEDSRVQWESFPLKKGLKPRRRGKRKQKNSAGLDSAAAKTGGRSPDEGDSGESGAESREVTPYEKCQAQRLALCQKLGRLLASF